MVVQIVDHRHEGLVYILESATTIGLFLLRSVLQECAPPRHEHDESIYTGRPPKSHAGSLRRSNLGPPFHDLAAESTDLHSVVLLIVVCVFVEEADDRWTFCRWESSWGLNSLSMI